MNRVKQVLFASIAALGLGSGAANAYSDPTTYLPAGVPIQFKYNDLEIIVSAVNDVLNGIFAISSIGSPVGSNIYWASGSLTGSELTGSFQGLTVAQITTTATGQNIYFTGGTLTIYSVPVGTYTPTGPANSIPGQICGGPSCPTPWLTMDFVPGVVLANDPTTPSFDDSTTTLLSTVSSLTAPLTGTGDGRLEITGGTAASTFNPNMSIQSNLQSCPVPVGDPFAPNCLGIGTWPLASFDPVVGTTAVPEPAGLALVGIALAGLGFSSRRSKKVA